jgi:hypothetical protein
MEADVNWTGFEALAGIWLLAVLVALQWLHARARFRQAILTLFIGTALFVTVTLFFFINRIEAYTQRAAIEFYKDLEGEDAVVVPLYFKSYAHLFYTRKQPHLPSVERHKEWLLHGDVDLPVYAISKITAEEEVLAIGTLEEIRRKNGFIFWRRIPAMDAE